MRLLPAVLIVAALAVGVTVFMSSRPDPVAEEALNAELRELLEDREFTGRIESTLEARLGRPVDARLAEVGRLLFFDPVLSLAGDNSCSGCHGPNESFNDSGSIAIGVGSNGVVGPGRRGPHNQRRAPTLINAAFYPRLMWDSRFSAVSFDPFRNDLGFTFPAPDGDSLSYMEHLLGAQAFTPVINRVEMAGSFAGDHVAMRAEVARRVDAIPEYRRLFGEVFPEVDAGSPLGMEEIAKALAEFQFTLVRADAPIDRFARGETDAMTADEKRGALVFFGPENCGECHIVRGFANEMFSDFDPHTIGVPQVVPVTSNMTFDGPGADEDFGHGQQTGRDFERYRFRTSPLRNLIYQPAFMHNGAYVCLEDAVRHHLQAPEYLRTYSPDHLDPAMRGSVGPDQPMLSKLHRFIGERPAEFSEEEFDQIMAFLRGALTDPGAAPDSLISLIPDAVPSGLPVHEFERDPRLPRGC